MEASVQRDVVDIVGPGAELVYDASSERFDVLPLLIATDGAIRAFSEDRRRLRPNLVIAGVDGLSHARQRERRGGSPVGRLREVQCSRDHRLALAKSFSQTIPFRDRRFRPRLQATCRSQETMGKFDSKSFRTRPPSRSLRGGSFASWPSSPSPTPSGRSSSTWTATPALEFPPNRSRLSLPPNEPVCLALTIVSAMALRHDRKTISATNNGALLRN